MEAGGGKPKPGSSQCDPWASCLLPRQNRALYCRQTPLPAFSFSAAIMSVFNSQPSDFFMLLPPTLATPGPYPQPTGCTSNFFSGLLESSSFFPTQLSSPQVNILPFHLLLTTHNLILSKALPAWGVFVLSRSPPLLEAVLFVSILLLSPSCRAHPCASQDTATLLTGTACKLARCRLYPVHIF